jgi:DNA-binding CsgD family transcriptional regulator/PAS domain-containing protein
MHETERLSALIGDIYDAALDSTLWVNVLGKTKDFVGGQAAALAWKDAATKRGDSYYADAGGISPHYRQLYFDKYIKLDPCTTGQFFAQIGEPVGTADLVPYEEFVQSRFYKEWAEPQALVDFALALLDKSASSISFLGLFRHKRHGLLDDETRRRMRLVAPHFRRAILISNVIDHQGAEAAALADTFDGISAGMFLVDAAGRIVHANASGHAMLDKTDVLRASGGSLVSNDPQADQILADTFSMASNGDAALGVKGVAVPIVALNGEQYVAHALPLTSGARRQGGSSYRATVALFVHKRALPTPSPLEAIASAYKLTPMELRVLLAIVEVGGVPEVADALGIAETTVKTHLGRVFAKTDTGRQADLVKLVAGFSSPLIK